MATDQLRKFQLPLTLQHALLLPFVWPHRPLSVVSTVDAASDNSHPSTSASVSTLRVEEVPIDMVILPLVSKYRYFSPSRLWFSSREESRLSTLRPASEHRLLLVFNAVSYGWNCNAYTFHEDDSVKRRSAPLARSPASRPVPSSRCRRVGRIEAGTTIFSRSSQNRMVLICCLHSFAPFPLLLQLTASRGTHSNGT